MGAWETRLGPLFSSSFSVEHLFHSGVWALGVGPGLGTWESDNSQACCRSQKGWVLGVGGVLLTYRPPIVGDTHVCSAA